MSKRNILIRILSLVLCFCLISSGVSASADIFTFETQYDYDSADSAWLTDLVIKEDMTSVSGMAQRVKLTAKPGYPYTETPESFSKEVDYFTALYTLDESSAKAAYLMFFEILNSGSGYIAADVNDEDIRKYLENSGIEYPDEVNADELMMARVLYAALISGAVSGDIFSGSTGLESALADYLVYVTGTDIETLKKWMPADSILSLDNYILAASKITLWTGGYDVSADTPAQEVYRLIAHMTISKQGITVDINAGFEEIRDKYIAAMTGKKYGVKAESAELAAAVKENNAAFYILQLMGRKHGLSVRTDNCTYEEAFKLVAENSDIFDIEDGEFYADIMTYEARLQGRCSSIWIYPTAISPVRSGFNTVITVNGQPVKDNYYTEISVDPAKAEQDLIIKVVCEETKWTKSECTYKVQLYQGKSPLPEKEETATPPVSGEGFVSSDSVVNDVLTSLGLDSHISDIVNKTYSSLPPELTNMMPYLAPTFDSDKLFPELNAGREDPAPADKEAFISVLDDLGSSFGNIDIDGIPGLRYAETVFASSSPDDFITFTD